LFYSTFQLTDERTKSPKPGTVDEEPGQKAGSRRSTMRAWIVFGTGVCLLLACSKSEAQSTRPDLEPKFEPLIKEICEKGKSGIDCFTSSASLTYLMCGAAAELAIVGAQDGRGIFERCVSNAKTHIAPAYDRARRDTAANKEATAILKDGYAYWLTAMDGLLPQGDETKLTYGQRRAQQRETLDHKLNRLKLEK
jgi:hypothetical protein